jgi:hypothetical protein
LRLAGYDYYNGKQNIEEWKREYSSNLKSAIKGRNKKLKDRNGKLLEKVDDFLTAEKLLFGKDKYGNNNLDVFWEKWHLDWTPLNQDYFRRMAKSGGINDSTKWDWGV